MSHDEFRDYWLNEHVPLAKELPGLRRYRTAVPVTPDRSRYDGIAELYFDTVGAFESVLGPESDTPAIEDVANFEKRADRCLVTETVRYNDPRSDGPKLKLVAVVSRCEGVSHEAFVDECFRGGILERPSSLRKLTTAEPVDGHETYDGVVECYFDGLGELDAATFSDETEQNGSAVDLPLDTSLVGDVESHVVEEQVHLDVTE
nr:EthD family reductase [Halogeometricum sp. CBA1124]